jgi:hypothetical protein
MMRVLLCFFMMVAATVWAELPMDVCFKGEEKFYALVEKMKPHAERLRSTPIGARTAYLGRWLVGTPYKGYTLEIHDRIEAPSVNLLGLDCWTFFETALAFARMVEEPVENWTPKTLLKYIELDRYWGGDCNGSYLSRLHYLEDWLNDNHRRGLIQDLTRALGGIGVRNSASEMTKNWKGYRYMRMNPHLREKPLHMIPKDKVAKIESRLQDGDVIGIISKDGAAYGTSHVGLAVRKNGILHFMHASHPRNHGKVVIDTRLSEYLARFKSHAGILVGRPLK